MSMEAAIDRARHKFDNHKPMTLNEACFTLWAEHYVCSHQYLAWKDAMIKRGYKRKRLEFDMWHGVFSKWALTEYRISDKV